MHDGAQDTEYFVHSEHSKGSWFLISFNLNPIDIRRIAVKDKGKTHNAQKTATLMVRILKKETVERLEI